MRKTAPLLALVLIAASLPACTHRHVWDSIIDSPSDKNRLGQNDDNSKPNIDALKDPYEYCLNIEQHAARTSGEEAALGIGLVALGVPTAAGGMGVGINEMARSNPGTPTVIGSSAVFASGLLGALLGAYFLDRSSAASAASAAASHGRNQDDKKAAWKDCTEARATWLSSRQKAIDDVKEERDHYRSLWETRTTPSASATGSAAASASAAPSASAAASGSSGVIGAPAPSASASAARQQR